MGNIADRGDNMSMEIDNHVFDRMSIRLDENEKQRVIDAIRVKWERLQNNQFRDFGIVALNLGDMRMTDNSGMNSNGEAVVGIVRRGTLKTVMLRRFNQPMTREALRVDVVKWAIKAPPVAIDMMKKFKKNRRW